MEAESIPTEAAPYAPTFKTTRKKAAKRIGRQTGTLRCCSMKLCKRMGLFESMLPESISLTDEQFQIFLEKTIAAEHSRRILDGLTAQRSVQTSARDTAYTEAQDEADEDE